MADLGAVIGYGSNDVFGRGVEILRTNPQALLAMIASPDPTDIRADEVNYPAEAEVEQDLVFGNLNQYTGSSPNIAPGDINYPVEGDVESGVVFGNTNQYTGSSVPVPPPNPVGAISAPLPPNPTGAING